MTNLFSLVKIELMNLFTRGTTGYVARKKKEFGIALVILPAMFMIYISSTYSMALLSSIPDELSYFVLLIMMIAGFMVLLVFSFYNAQGHLFGFKDYNLLMSLPVRKIEIMLSKLFAFLILDYFYAFFLTAPSLILYAFYFPQGLSYWLFAILGFLTMPLIPIVISSLFAILIYQLAGNSRFRNLIQNVLSFLMIALIFLASFNIPTLFVNVKDFNEILNLIETFIPNIYYFVFALSDGNFSYFLISLLINLLPFGLFVLFFARSFTRLNENIYTGYKIKNYKIGKLKSQSKLVALFLKELRRYFSSSLYVLNTSIGVLMIFVMSIAAIFQGQKIFDLMFEISNIGDLIFPACCLILMCSTMMSCTTGVSISLEGNKLWIIKSLPINIQEYLLSKAMVNWLVIIPISTLSSIILAIAFKLSIIQGALMILVCILSAVFTSFFGLIVNLNFPKMEWDREVIVIKQSMSSFISLIGGLLIGVGVGALYFALDGAIPVMSYILIMMLLFIIVNALMWLYLVKKGNKLFLQL